MPLYGLESKNNLPVKKSFTWVNVFPCNLLAGCALSYIHYMLVLIRLHKGHTSMQQFEEHWQKTQTECIFLCLSDSDEDYIKSLVK